ncbi:MAG TPA: sulfurtransferase complex subunit TusB [Gammaproteobacteria bacterium]|nr:sulfurtransferase complex subunit TusB [Gammaproteobacteria bacterium]
MTMLHTVNKSPFERRTLDSCLRHAQPDSAVLLIEDGVYGAFNGTAITGKVQDAIGNFKMYVLGPDVRARGMDESHVLDGITVVDYEGFVDLVAEHDKVQAWL